jgi:hypothetical protein
MSDNDYSETAEGDPQSSIMISGYNLEKYSIESNFTYVDVIDVDTLGYWTVALNEISVGGDDVLTPDNTKRKAIIDTGTSLLIGPIEEVTPIIQKIASMVTCE